MLHGGEGFTNDMWEEITRTHSVSKETAEHLAAKFGSSAWDVLALAKENPHLAPSILPGGAPIRAEVVYSVREEFAMTIEDVLARRLGVQFWSWREAIHAAPVAGALIAQELQWSPEYARSSISTYIDKINHLLERAGLEPEKLSGSSTANPAAV